jgi:quercetin dioxygenase-like cupin family protein
MRTRFAASLAVLALSPVILPLAAAHSAAAATNQEVSRRVLERRDIAGTDEELRLMVVEFPAGYSNAAHRHPVAGLCYVIAGTAESQYEGEQAKIIGAGESFQDEADKRHVVFRNVSSTDELKFVCSTKIRKDLDYLLPE